ncbi:MAG TPA: large conductance mechanosensitive channel protein MscL [Oceanobacillus sp.]|nr:large conductance mechanosensitive channel protein MscL [Oceanobacillus sp.]
MIAEFRKFILRGNVVDLAVGIIIGAAFTAIVNSLVTDVLTPPLGLITGGINFSETYILLQPGDPPPPYASLEAATNAGAVTINIGLFINALIQFLITAIAVFFIVKAVNTMNERFSRKKEEEAAPGEPSTEEKLVAAINRLNENLERQQR